MSTAALRRELVDPAASDEIKSRAHQILSDGQFKHILDEAPRFDVSEQLAYYLHRLGMWLQSLGSTVQWAIVGVCLLVLLAILLHVFSLLRRVLVSGPETSSGRLEHLEAAPVDPTLEQRRAEAAAAAGDYTRALRHLHRFLRLELARRRLLPYHESWTNWEYLQAVGRTGLPLGPLQEFTARCDQAFYGGSGGNREDYQASLSALREVFAGPSVGEGP